MRDNKLMRDSLRAMDRAERSVRQGQTSAAPAWYQKQFDRRVPGLKTRKEEIGHTLFFGPDESSIEKTVQKYARAGWAYVARTEERCLLDLIPFTRLTFQPGRRGRRRTKGKRHGCLATLTLIVGIVAIVIVLAAL